MSSTLLSSCNAKIPDKAFAPCEPGPNYIAGIEVINPITKKLHTTKIIYNYKDKTKDQIKEIIQTEINTVLFRYRDYKYIDAKSHFNETGGIELQLNFELK
jgi:hypothetical protein